MDRIIIRRSIYGFPITAIATAVGEDLEVKMFGGCTPHIGSISFAWWDDDGVTLKNIVRPQHKDHFVGNQVARHLAETLQCAVSVECGIHYDGPSKTQIEAIVECAGVVLDSLTGRLLDMRSVKKEK